MSRSVRMPLCGVFRWFGAAVAVAYLCGCGDGNPRTYPIPGRLIYSGGAAVSGATVVFQTTIDGKPVNARALVGDDGRFLLTTFRDNDGLVAGEHRIVVLPLPPEDGAKPAMPAVDRRYGDFETSGLSATVTPQTSELLLEIERAGKK